MTGEIISRLSEAVALLASQTDGETQEHLQLSALHQVAAHRSASRFGTLTVIAEALAELAESLEAPPEAPGAPETPPEPEPAPTTPEPAPEPVQPPTRPPEGPRADDVLLEFDRTHRYATRAPNDRATLEHMFPTMTDPGGALPGWADPSTSLAYNGDGRAIVTFDERRIGEGGRNTGGSSWSNAAVPLPRPVGAARIAYRVTPLGPWHWGKSGKLPGLARWVADAYPGGGVIHPENTIVRPCWEDWNADGKGLRFGPYCYGQDRTVPATEPDLRYAPDFERGTLRWWAPVIPVLDAPGGSPHTADPFTVEMDLVPWSGPGLWDVIVTLNGMVLFRKIVKLTGGGVPKMLTHLSWCLMYGGANRGTGPHDHGLASTAVAIDDFHVLAL